VSSPVRPVFSDGSILGADDLTALGQLDRDRDARHARHLHTPGIAAGLELTTEESVTTSDATYVEVTLQPGYAVDGTGRELVVAAPLPVSHDRFLGDVPNPVEDTSLTNTTVWYPVFVRGLDAALATSNGQIGCQTGSGPRRIAEDVEIEFGRPGDANAEQSPPAPDAGPGNGSWRVLVGFVRLNTDIDRFIEVTTIADGIGVPTAGARAGLVAGRDGRVEIRPRPAAAAGVPAVVLDAEKGGSLVFGLHDGAGAVSPLLSVDASGNLAVSGTIDGVQTAGSVLVVSGSAFDGTVLPLPAGADQDAIESGDLELSVLVYPRHQAPLSASYQRFIPAECRVDENRRVHCWGTWFDPTVTPSATNVAHVSSSCDYLVLVSVPKGGA
jgi:hypothetical protein